MGEPTLSGSILSLFKATGVGGGAMDVQGERESDGCVCIDDVEKSISDFSLFDDEGIEVFTVEVSSSLHEDSSCSHPKYLPLPLPLN